MTPIQLAGKPPGPGAVLLPSFAGDAPRPVPARLPAEQPTAAEAREP